MKTEEIEKQLFIAEDVPPKDITKHKPSEAERYRMRQEQKEKEWDAILASTDSELIKCYRKYRHLLDVNRIFFVDGDCWEIIFALFDKLKIDKNYVLDDYRSKASTNNILNLYARHKKTPKPTERKFIEWEYCHKSIIVLHPSNPLGIDVDLIHDGKPGIDEPKNMPPMIQPHEVITLDFDALSIWQAYLLRITDYFIGQRWHGHYHNMEIIFNPERDISIFMMSKEERMEYAQQLEALNPDYEPHVIIDGNTATIKHFALIGDTRITECTCTITYNQKTRKIEKFEFDDSELIKIPRNFWY